MKRDTSNEQSVRGLASVLVDLDVEVILRNGVSCSLGI
jgi:hypothetical protein